MRKFIGTFIAALIAIACTPYAHADVGTSGTYNFTVTNGSPEPTGSFVWDSTTSTWNSFIVDWDGAVYNFGSYLRYNHPLSTVQISGTWCDAAPDTTTVSCLPQEFFNLSGVGGALPEAFNFTDIFAGANGTYTLKETPVVITPEPGSLALMLIGVVALGFFTTHRRAGAARSGASRARRGGRFAGPHAGWAQRLGLIRHAPARGSPQSVATH